MRNSLLTAIAVLLLVASANADAKFYNITNKELKYNIILPNGVKKDDGSAIDDGSSTAGETSSISFDYRIKDGVTYEILDDMGNVAAKGPLNVSMTYLIYEDGGAIKVVPSGFHGGDGSLKAGVVANMTGQAGKVDFVGQNGLDAQTGLTLPTTLDTTKPFRYANGEETYIVKFNGETIEQKLNSSGRFWVIHRGGNGKIVLSTLGNIKK